MSWVIVSLWIAGYLYTVRWALLWTVRNYARNGLEWNGDDSAFHALMFGIVGAAGWPLWWVGAAAWITVGRGRGGLHRRLLQESADNWQSSWGNTPKYVQETRRDQ